ncbi:hypothetical protein [Brevundimonas sp.]|uniref:hypothetical protein n=1 Tax=Brevundimonas sp. TaxID=1871086 RepID=UPI003D13457A
MIGEQLLSGSTPADFSHPLWAAAAVRERFQAETLLRAWLKNHPDSTIEELSAASAAALSLKSVAAGAAAVETVIDGVVVDPVLALPDLLRARILRGLGVVGALEAVTQADRPTQAEQLFQLALTQDLPAINADDRVQLAALAKIEPWTQALGLEPVVAPDTLRADLRRIDFLEALGGPDLHRFVGRVRLLKTLNAAWSRSRDTVARIGIEGPGGIGKSLAVSRFVSDVLEGDANDAPDAVFHLDFDRPGFRSARLPILVAELARQAVRYFNVDPERVSRLTRHDSRNRELLGSGRGSDSFREISYDIAALVGALHMKGHIPRIVLVVDSLEQIDGFDFEAVNSLHRLESMLRNEAKVFTILVSRAFSSDFKGEFRFRPTRLGGLTVPEAEQYLRNEAERLGLLPSQTLLRDIRKVVGVSPLALRLAISLIDKSEGEIDPAAWLRAAETSDEAVQAGLYDRILDRIRDPDLRKLARPGLLVRRLDSDLISEVLAGPCEIDLAQRTPESLMEVAEQEGQLFERDPNEPGTLRHRADVRTTMLRLLDESLVTAGQSALVKYINEAAVSYYAAQSTPAARVEELYHRLRLDQAFDLLEDRWTPDVEIPLRQVVSEFPINAQRFVLAHAGGRYGARANAVPSGFIDQRIINRELEQTFTRRLHEGEDLDDLVREIEDRDLGDLSGPAGAVVAESLVAQGKAEILLSSLSSSANKTSGRRFSDQVLITAAAAAEGLRRHFEAERLWVQARRQARGANTVNVRIAAVAGCARIRRKLFRNAESRTREVNELRDLVTSGLTELMRNTTLVREAAAELGDDLLSPMANRSAFWTVRDLLSQIVRTGDALPSSAEGPDRRRLLASRLGLPQGEAYSERSLDEALTRLVFSEKAEDTRRLVSMLRAEVDWTLERAVRRAV